MDFRNQNNNDSRNLILAVAISAMLLLGFEAYMRATTPPQPAPQQAQTAQTGEQTANPADALAPPAAQQTAGMPGAPASAFTGGAQGAADIAPTAQQARRIPLTSNVLNGAVALTGGRLDELAFPRFDTRMHEEDKIVHFAPSGEHVEFFDAGWQGQGIAAPGGDTQWQVADGARLKPGQPLTLTWENASGQRFERTFQVANDSYAIDVTDKVVNTAGQPVQLAHYAQIHKADGTEGVLDPREKSTFINFIGPQASFGEEKLEVDYSDLQDKARPISRESREGWMAMTSRYFMSALIPEQGTLHNFIFRHSDLKGRDFYTITTQAPGITVAPGQAYEHSYRLYAGPRLFNELEKENVNLEWSIDYGWFHFIAKPLHELILWFDGWVSNLGWAIVLATVVLKLLLFPLANRSYKAMATMKKLQPKMEQLKERYKDNREQFAMEMMALYREHKVNPASGCWPMLIQIPIFYALYKVILVSFEFRHADFALWIHDLSEKDPYFVLPVLMGLSMWVQQKLNPPMADPVQQKVMGMLPIIFTVLFAFFPSGLVLYWLVNNILSVAQQWFINKRVAGQA